MHFTLVLFFSFASIAWDRKSKQKKLKSSYIIALNLWDKIKTSNVCSPVIAVVVSQEKYFRIWIFEINTEHAIGALIDFDMKHRYFCLFFPLDLFGYWTFLENRNRTKREKGGLMRCGQKALETFSCGAKLMNDQRRFCCGRWKGKRKKNFNFRNNLEKYMPVLLPRCIKQK